MQKILSRKAPDLVLLEMSWKMASETTFEESESSLAMSLGQEELFMTPLAMRCEDYMDSREWIYRGEFDYYSRMIMIVIVARMVCSCCQWQCNIRYAHTSIAVRICIKLNNNKEITA